MPSLIGDCALREHGVWSGDTAIRLRTISEMGDWKQNAASNVAGTYKHLWRYLQGSRDDAQVSCDGGSELTRVEVRDVIGWKVAIVTSVEPLHFGGYSWGGYGTTSVAACRRRDHLAPDWHCRCGFHAYRERSGAEGRMRQREHAVLLRVAFYGNVIEHQEGWRAAEQDVVGVHVQSRCSARRCTQASDALTPSGLRYATACATHAKEGSVRLESIRRLNGLDLVADL